MDGLAPPRRDRRPNQSFNLNDFGNERAPPKISSGMAQLLNGHYSGLRRKRSRYPLRPPTESGHDGSRYSIDESVPNSPCLT